MKTTPQNDQRTNPTRQFGGNSVTESVSLIDLLFETYLDAGLKQTEAWDAALADYAHGFFRAA